MNEQTNKRMNVWTNEQKNKQTNKRKKDKKRQKDKIRETERNRDNQRGRGREQIVRKGEQTEREREEE